MQRPLSVPLTTATLLCFTLILGCSDDSDTAQTSDAAPPRESSEEPTDRMAAGAETTREVALAPGDASALSEPSRSAEASPPPVALSQDMPADSSLEPTQESSVPAAPQEAATVPAPELAQPGSPPTAAQPASDPAAPVAQAGPSSEADKLKAAATLSEAAQTTTAYEIIGPNTKNFVALYNFYEAAGWNDFIDGMTMKSCPEQYEFFCETRNQFILMYQNMGGDPAQIIDAFQAMDLRDQLYQQAVAADTYQKQSMQQQGKK